MLSGKVKETHTRARRHALKEKKLVNQDWQLIYLFGLAAPSILKKSNICIKIFIYQIEYVS